MAASGMNDRSSEVVNNESLLVEILRIYGQCMQEAAQTENIEIFGIEKSQGNCNTAFGQ